MDKICDHEYKAKLEDIIIAPFFSIKTCRKCNSKIKLNMPYMILGALYITVWVCAVSFFSKIIFYSNHLAFFIFVIFMIFMLPVGILFILNNGKYHDV